MKIVVDAFGGDNAPQEIVKGAIAAVQEDSELEIILTGKENVLRSVLVNENYSGAAISVLPASEVIGNDESPTTAIKKKKNSSMVVALEKLKSDDTISGVISAGSTGALLTGAFTIIRRIKGISRPSLVPVCPTVTGGKFVISDCGANADCKPINLVHFALVGSAFMSAMYGIERPRVGLLCNGAEEGKGNALVKDTFPLLANEPDINFIGNIEARDMLSGDVDVVVTDGFTGNIALKASEGMAKVVMTLLKRGINDSGIKGKLGALMLKGTLKNIKSTLDHSEQAGGTFLGVEKIVVKAHGSSGAKSIQNCIMQVKTLAQADIINKIKGLLANCHSSAIKPDNELQ